MSHQQMIKKLSLFLGFAILSFSSFAQTEGTTQTTSKRGRPDIPGFFSVEFGFNQGINKPDSLFSTSFWGSRTVNIYYQGDYRIGTSKFSVHPGIGLGLERYKFKDNYTLGYKTDSQEVEMIPSPFDDTKKSMVVMNYFDIPVDFRFTLNPDDPNRSFKVAVGGRIGFLYDSFLKFKYREDGETKKLKDKQDYSLNPLRYGISLKVGVGNFHAFGYYDFSPKFEKDLGPQKTDMTNIVFGISVSAF